MALTNAQIQAAYRARHCKDVDSATASRIDTLIDTTSMTALKRLAASHGISQRAMLQTLINDAEASLLSTLSRKAQSTYYDSIKL